MSTRRVRDDQHRRIFAAGLALSIAIHGVVLGMSTFSAPPASEGESEAVVEPERRTFDQPALELVDITTAPAVTVVAAAPEPVGRTERIATNPTPSAASPASLIEAQLALSMRPDFNTQRSMSSWALQPIQALGDANGGLDSNHPDSGEDEESGGRSWWEGLGISIGGGGGHCPVPNRPPVVISN